MVNDLLAITLVVAGIAVLFVVVPILADAVFRVGDFICDLLGWPRGP